MIESEYDARRLYVLEVTVDGHESVTRVRLDTRDYRNRVLDRIQYNRERGRSDEEMLDDSTALLRTLLRIYFDRES